MRYFQLIEKRSNADLNVKTTVDAELQALYSTDKNQFVTFTNVKKFGINPYNGFETPTAIYSYPLEYVVNTGIKNLPFANTRPFIWVFKIQGHGLIVSQYNEPKLRNDQQKLQKYAESKGCKDVIEMPYYPERILESLSISIWRTIEAITGEEYDWERPPVIVSTIIESVLGYTFWLDDGTGSIDGHEPTQCALYNVSAAFNKKLILNYKSPSFDTVTVRITDSMKKVIRVAGEGSTIRNGNSIVHVYLYNGIVNMYESPEFSIAFFMTDKQFNGTYQVSIGYERQPKKTVNSNTPLLDIFNMETQNYENIQDNNSGE